MPLLAGSKTTEESGIFTHQMNMHMNMQTESKDLGWPVDKCVLNPIDLSDHTVMRSLAVAKIIII